MENTSEQKKMQELQKEYELMKKRFHSVLLDNERLRKEGVITIRKIKTVEPPDYKSNKALLREKEKRIKKLEQIIEYGNISTVESIVNEYKLLSVKYFDKLSRELQSYSICREEREELLELLAYLEKIRNELEKFIFVNSKQDGEKK